MSIIFDEKSFYSSIELYDQIKINNEIPLEKVDFVLNTEGMNFLKKHLNHYGGTQFDKELYVKLLKKVLHEKNTNNFEESIILRSIKKGLDNTEFYINNFKKLNIKKITENAFQKAKLYLPFNEDKEEDIKLYLLYGIRGTAIILENEIAIDIVDDYLEENGEINEAAFIEMLAHELHHIFFQKFLTKQLKNTIDIKEKNKIQFIGELLSEGTATFYFTNPYRMNDLTKEVWGNNLNNFDNLFEEVKKVLEQVSNIETPIKEETWHLYDDNLIGYTVGYVMVKTIDETFGKEKVLECIKNHTNFFDFYNNAIIQK
jgi:hypothetical protein